MTTTERINHRVENQIVLWVRQNEANYFEQRRLERSPVSMTLRTSGLLYSKREPVRW